MLGRLVVPCAVLLALAGCASSNPALYSLDGRPGPVRAGPHRLVVVHGVNIPRYLERLEIVRSSGQTRLRVSGNDWWGEPLRAMLRRVLIANLSQRLPNSDVLADDSPIASRPDAEVEVEVQRFDQDPTGPVVFVGYAAVTQGGRQRPLQRLRFDVPTVADTTQAQVQAMSAALGQVANVVAAALASQNAVTVSAPKGAARR